MTAKIFHPLLALIASATSNELAKYIEFLKEENKILRARLPGQIHTKPEERSRLVKLGKAIGQAVEELLTIVSPSTFYRWCREDGRSKQRKSPRAGQRKAREIREFVIEVARTTSFGYTRILGELRKVGIKNISRQTVRNILKEEGIEPSPNRKNDCWDNFIKRHAETLWAVDFFSVKSVTLKGIRDLYLMVFLCLETREIIVTESTEHPNSAWVVERTNEFLSETMNREKTPSILMHDRDTKFTKEFKAAVTAAGVRLNKLPITSPNLNGRCERVILTLKYECLFKFILFGKAHLDHVVQSFVVYYNARRSHMEREHLPPIRNEPDEVQKFQRSTIEMKSYVGGLVHSFERKAA
jgi:putative transposase